MAPETNPDGTTDAKLLLQRMKVMETIVRNSLLFISGFIVALAIFRSPLNINSNFKKKLNPSYASSNSQQDQKDTLKYSSSNSQDLAQRPSIGNKLLKNSKVLFNVASRNDLSGRPDNSERIQEQIPTAPPTGRPETANEDSEENKEEKKEKIGESVAKSVPTKNYDTKPKDDEASLSSVSGSNQSYVGAITEAPKTATQTAAVSQVSVVRSGSGSSSGDNTSSNVIPDDFTQAGFKTAQRLYNSESLSESEYLDYLSLGLISSDSSLVSLALNELVSLKNRNAFSVLTQYANSSQGNIQNINKAVLANYRNAADLKFLSLMISDTSSTEIQSFAIHSLDIILDGSTMDFSSQQIKDTLVNNIGNSLIKIDSSHPSFSLAQTLSAEINRKLS
jgi:hypothetical protein